VSGLVTFFKPFPETVPELQKIAYSVFDKAVRGLEEHDHGTCMELVVVEAGQEIYRVEEKDYILNGGSFFIAPPHLRHSSGIHPRSKHKHYCILIDLGLERPFLGSENTEPLRKTLSALPALSAGHDAELLKTARRIVELCQSKASSLRDIEANALLSLLLLQVVRKSCQIQKQGHDFPIQKALDLLEANISENLSVESMAEKLHMSASSFKKGFRQATGIAPAEYFLRMKLNKARFMIQCSDMSITEISGALGFSSSQYFATSFKRYHLFSPMAWKNNQR
jgi:AraC-like DNA-binding protein